MNNFFVRVEVRLIANISSSREVIRCQYFENLTTCIRFMNRWYKLHYEQNKPFIVLGEGIKRKKEISQ